MEKKIFIKPSVKTVKLYDIPILADSGVTDGGKALTPGAHGDAKAIKIPYGLKLDM